MNNLIWFNSKGDALNIVPDQTSGIYNGTLNFDENSSDTFKTIGLYLFEKVDSIEFESVSNDLNLQKLQLFNENRITFSGNSNFTQSVTSIKASNNNPEFFSKWVYGENFDSKFPIGSSIIFNNNIFEFTSPNTIYTVIGTRNNAIMILSSIDNKNFTTLYDSLTFSDVSISGVNSIGVYDYRRGLIDQLSSWNEPTFYNNLYNGQKLNIINSGSTSSNFMVSIKDKDIFDRVYYKYNIDYLNYTQSSDISATITLKSHLPNIYSGGINIVSSNNGYNLYFDNSIPKILKPGTQFIINDSASNANKTITVSPINSFVDNVNKIYYGTYSQVIWNNIIYECIQSYSYSATSSIDPNNSNYWTSSITYLPTSTELIEESIVYTTLHLSNNKFNFSQSFTNSNEVTMALFARNNADTFNLFNIDLSYKSEDKSLNADLKYSSKYAEIDFKINGTQSITNIDRVFEKVIRTNETLYSDINKNLSSNFKYSIVINNIDDFGIKFTINNEVYVETVEYVYNGLLIDEKRTIDRTLRNFLYNNISRLTSLGITTTLETSVYTGSFDFFKDTITFESQYPNVPINIVVEMGELADHYTKYSKIEFNDIGNYLNININNKDYGIRVTSTTSSTFIPDISSAITNWVSEYRSALNGYGIYVSNVRNILYFNLEQPLTGITYSIRTAKLSTPGIDQYTTTNYIEGNFGTLITGNQLILGATSSQNFEEAGFATGMIASINNTSYPYNNQEYNIIYLEPDKIGLSYQGPFWSTYESECSLSAYTTLAFSPLAYGATSCPEVVIGGSGSGEFHVLQFDSGFNISYNNDIIFSDISLTTLVTGNTDASDILYVNEFSRIYVAGDKIAVIDANTFEFKTLITTSYTNISKIIYNGFNNYLYAISGNYIIIIDPVTNTEYTTINIGTSINDVLINQTNGDVYISFGSSVHIYYYNSFTSANKTFTVTNAGKMEYNLLNDYVYISGDKVYSINALSRVLNTTSYSITSLDNDYIYTEPIYGSIYVWGDYLYKITEAGVTSSINLTNNGSNKIIYDNLSDNLFLTQDNLNLSKITSSDGIVYTKSFDYGDITLNQYDACIYMIGISNKVHIIDTNSGSILHSEPLAFSATKVVYNPERESIIVMGTNGEVLEIKTTIASSITLSNSVSTPSSTSDGLYGSLNSDYTEPSTIWIKTRDYIRAPRINYEGDNQAKLVYKFVDDTVEEIFMYDISGEQLTTGTSYSYTGIKPLPEPRLNSSANMDITKINDSSVQQTIFEEIKYTLDYVDSNTDVSILPTPIELFLGYNDNVEGYSKNTLKLYLREVGSYSLTYSAALSNDISFHDNGTSSKYPNGYGSINMATMSLLSFVENDDIKTGLKAGQKIKLEVTDTTNSKNKYISYNSGKEFIIEELYNNQIIVKYIEDEFGDISYLTNELSYVEDYPEENDLTILKVKFIILDKELATIDLYGQTEVEDERYKIELYNSGGHNINPEDAYIFKTYDIDEQGIDWTFLNKKRKEMLIVRSDIFPYVGSYKAIINAINYFGYNDLVLNEYYRNIDINSENFYKLFKVEIPDIFDNSVEGFTVNDFLKHTMPNPNFEETNLFNLTYNITDKNGENVLLYSLQEVLIKLQGLKKWLERNVIPITHKVLDITGRTDVVSNTYIRHKVFSRTSLKSTENITPIDFYINEAYLMPVNSGSTIYNVVIDFVASKEGTLPKDFSVVIKTYKTYKEWNPFTTYQANDQVIYYGKIYKSNINSNRILDPRKYENSPEWEVTTDYYKGEIVNYDRRIYEFTGTQSSFEVFGTQSVPTPAQSDRWLDISEWILQDLYPVQTIREYRSISGVTYSNNTSNILYYPNNVVEPDYITVSNSFNFTIDSNIDPFISVEIVSDNGYGIVYSSKKNYEIRGLNDLYAGVTNIESIGPFVPITPVTNKLSL